MSEASLSKLLSIFVLFVKLPNCLASAQEIYLRFIILKISPCSFLPDMSYSKSILILKFCPLCLLKFE